MTTMVGEETELEVTVSSVNLCDSLYHVTKSIKIEF